jgi:anti-anti-sigma factor
VPQAVARPDPRHLNRSAAEFGPIKYDGAVKPFSIDVQRTDGYVRVILAGELDIATHGDADVVLRDVQDAGSPLVVLDLRELKFMDSTGLRLLVQADSRARESGQRLAIVRGPEAVHRVLEITGLDAKLDLIDDPADVTRAAD